MKTTQSPTARAQIITDTKTLSNMDLDKRNTDELWRGLNARLPSRQRKCFRKMAQFFVLSSILFIGPSVSLFLLDFSIIFGLTYSDLMLILQVSPITHESNIPLHYR